MKALPFGPERRDAWRVLNFQIGRKNQLMIDGCDAIFAVLDGTDVDSGTAAEIAYGFAKGKRILGYRGDFRLSADNEGGIVNLQVEYFIRASGGDIIQQLDELPEALAKMSGGNGGDAAMPTAPIVTNAAAATTTNKSPVMAVVAIILALVVKAALDKAFSPMFSGANYDWHTFVGLPAAELGIFFILTFRFYLGVLRFSETEPKRIDFLVRSFNFVFSFFVFVAFYITALSVTSAKYFYLDIVVLHSVDATWFLLLFLISFVKYVPERLLERGEMPIHPIRVIMATYFVLSGATILWGLLAYPYIFGASLTDPAASNAHWSFLVVLLIFSFLDFALLHNYYFYFDDWKRDNGVIP